MKKKSLFAVALVCALGLAVTGCNQNQELTLSQQDQELVTEYATSVLMKYNAGSNMRVLSGKELLQAEAEDQAAKEREAKRQQLAEEYQQSQQAQGTATTVSSGGKTQTTVPEQSIAMVEDLGSFFAIDQMTITYQNYEVTDSYGQPDEEVMMAMDATAGNSLLVAHFSVTNNSSETVHLDILSKEGKFRLKAGDKTLQSQYTLLLNDLSMYKGDIEAGATIDTVLIFELSQEQVNAESLELIVSLGEQRGSIVLK